MMRLRICPECYKAFFLAADGGGIVCPHCSHMLADRRVLCRVKKEFDVTLFIRGSEVQARTVDFSEKGAGIIYRGGFLEADSVIHVAFGRQGKKQARAVWSKKVSRSVISVGLCFEASKFQEG